MGIGTGLAKRETTPFLRRYYPVQVPWVEKTLLSAILRLPRCIFNHDRIFIYCQEEFAFYD